MPRTRATETPHLPAQGEDPVQGPEPDAEHAAGHLNFDVRRASNREDDEPQHQGDGNDPDRHRSAIRGHTGTVALTARAKPARHTISVVADSRSPPEPQRAEDSTTGRPTRPSSTGRLHDLFDGLALPAPGSSRRVGASSPSRGGTSPNADMVVTSQCWGHGELSDQARTLEGPELPDGQPERLRLQRHVGDGLPEVVLGNQ